MRQGFAHCKVVGRGSAVERAIEVLKEVMEKAPQHSYEWSETKSLNKSGYVVNEIHIMVSLSEAQSSPPSGAKNQTYRLSQPTMDSSQQMRSRN